MPPIDESIPQPPPFTVWELAELRSKFATWDDDWNAPGMEAYDPPESQTGGDNSAVSTQGAAR